MAASLTVTPSPMRALAKDWDRHVAAAEELARGTGFRRLRDAVLDMAPLRPGERVVDVGAGTGLLTLVLAERAAAIWAVDISPIMCDYLKAKAASAGHRNVETVVASAVSLPLVDGCADLVVSNYCFHHLNDSDKRRALAEVHRVLVPGGRLAFADMMFRPALTNSRDRRLVATKVRSMLGKGPGGVVRVLRNASRFALGSWDKPARADWWEGALLEAGFVDVRVEPLEHEGGVAAARKPE